MTNNVIHTIRKVSMMSCVLKICL